MTKSNSSFISSKVHDTSYHGFDSISVPDFLFDFQKTLVGWSLRKGRGAIFAGTGLGKTAMQLVFADNIVRKTNKPVLILAPLSVTSQTVREGDKFGIECKHPRS